MIKISNFKDYKDFSLRILLSEINNFINKYKTLPSKSSKIHKELALVYLTDFLKDLEQVGLLNYDQQFLLNNRDKVYSIMPDSLIKLCKKYKYSPALCTFEEIELTLMLPKYKEFIQKHGRMPLVSSKDKDELWLAHWANHMIKQKNAKFFNGPQTKLIESAGGAFEPYMSVWLEDFEEIRKMVFGKGNDAFKYPFCKSWKKHQKNDYVRGLLNPEQIELISSLGIKLTPSRPKDKVNDQPKLTKEELWANKLKEVIVYKKEYGCLPQQVEITDKNDCEFLRNRNRLAYWTYNQRRRLYEGKLTLEQYKQLKSNKIRVFNDEKDAKSIVDYFETLNNNSKLSSR